MIQDEEPIRWKFIGALALMVLALVVLIPAFVTHHNKQVKEDWENRGCPVVQAVCYSKAKKYYSCINMVLPREDITPPAYLTCEPPVLK